MHAIIGEKFALLLCTKLTFIDLSSLLECSIRNLDDAIRTVISSEPCRRQKGI